MKRIKNLGYDHYISFDGINYSIYRSTNNEITHQVFLTIDDLEKINDFVFKCEKQALEEDE